MKPGPKPSTSKLTKKQKKLTNQYLSGLKRSIERIDSQSFDYYPVKLSNTRLLKFLIGQAYIKKEFLPDMVEKTDNQGFADRCVISRLPKE